MKNLTGILVISLLLATTGYSQQKRDRAHRVSDFSPEQIATIKSKKMTLHLDLNENQQQEVFKLFKDCAEESKNARTNFKKEKGTSLSSDEKFKLKNAKLDRKIAHKKALQKILTKEQFQKWENSNTCKNQFLKKNTHKMKKQPLRNKRDFNRRA